MKKQKIKHLAFKPLDTLRKGLYALEEDFYKKEVLSQYGIDNLPTIEFKDLVPSGRITLEVYSYLDGTSLPTDIALLKALCEQRENCDYFEIGSWRGESIANVAKAANSCTSLTLSEEEMKDFGFGENFAKVHGFYSKDIDKLVTHYSDSMKFDFSKLGKKFDVIFVDGSHTYEGVLSDTKNVLKLLKDKNSVIVWHDFAFGVEDTRFSVFKAILDAVPKEKHKNLYRVSNTMCAVYMENCPYETSLKYFPSLPKTTFTIDLKLD